jgi:outer membrane protein
LLLTALSVLAFSGSARAAEKNLKVGTIDSQRIFREYQEAKDAEAVFQDEMKQWQSDLEGMEREILSLREKIRSQQLLLSQDKLDELQSQLEQKSQAYDQKRSEILDPTNGLAVKRNQELSQPINDQITTVVERLGAEGGYDLILDTSTVNIVYQNNELDLTDKVLQELEQSGK